MILKKKKNHDNHLEAHCSRIIRALAIGFLKKFRFTLLKAILSIILWCPNTKYLIDFEVRLPIYLFKVGKEFSTM